MVGIPHNQINPMEVVYSSFDGDDDFFLAVTRLYEHLKETNRPIVKMPVSVEHANYVGKNRGIEFPRMLRLSAVPFEQWEPIIVCQMKDDSFEIVDGNHRYVRAAGLGKTEIDSWTLKYREWQPFRIIGMPQDITANDIPKTSGIM